jgi:hypothetical protein
MSESHLGRSGGGEMHGSGSAVPREKPSKGHRRRALRCLAGVYGRHVVTIPR